MRTPAERVARRGLAAAEMAILLPFVCLMFAVALDFCRVYHTTQTLYSSANSAAMFASGTARAGSTISLEDAAKRAALADASRLSPPLSADDITVAQNATTATVTVRYAMQPLTPLWNVGQQIVLTRTVTLNRAPSPGD